MTKITLNNTQPSKYISLQNVEENYTQRIIEYTMGIIRIRLLQYSK